MKGDGRLVTKAGIGSFFPYPDAGSLDVAGASGSSESWPPRAWSLFNSGRAALQYVVSAHRLSHHEGVLWIPSFYCWDVTRYVQRSSPVKIYPCRPTEQSLPTDIHPDDLVLIASYFGAEPPAHPFNPRQVVLDTTHDPLATWIDTSRVGWVIGSLRKTLPLPEGGYAYSMRDASGLSGDLPDSDESRREALRGADAMKMKAKWIQEDQSDDKQEWYRALTQHEVAFEQLKPASLQPENQRLLRSLPVASWREARLRNLALLRKCLGPHPWEIALPATYGLVLVLASRVSADSVRRQLLSRGVYPARLWPQPKGASGPDADLADRILQIHTDYRYTESQMAEVAHVLQTALADAGFIRATRGDTFT